MVKEGDRVRIEFIGKLDDGLEFANSYRVEEPFEFTVGAGEVLGALEEAVRTLSPGEDTDIRVPAAQAYGEYDESLIERVPIAMFPNSEKLKVGEFIEMYAGGEEIRARVRHIEDGWIYFDHNHELAGEDLNFYIKLVEIIG